MSQEKMQGGISLAQEQGVDPQGQGLSLNVLLANALASLEQKRVDFPSLIAVLSLFNLFSVLNSTPQVQSRAGVPAPGNADLAGMITGLLSGGGSSGKSLNPQMLLSLLSLLSEAKSGASGAAAAEGAQPASPERRSGRGLL